MKIPREYVTHGIVAVASLAIGGGASYLITKHFLETKLDQVLEDEMAVAKEYYENMYKKIYKKEEYEEVLSARETEEEESATATPPVDYNTISAEEPSTKLENAVKEIKRSIEENRSIFENSKEINDLDVEEINDRNPEVPYIITEHEFSENSLDHDQISLSYFEEDDVLTDENDGVIEDSDSIVGDDNLTRFGHGSGNHNILFVRNERMSTDFEIAKSNGSYAREVLGFIEHSDDSRTRIRRFRGDDE